MPAVEFVEVDGSQGEGGGQILRAAVAFSAIEHRPVRVSNIRAGRAVPGLKRQHVSVLRILATVFGGQITGVSEGSSTVTFVPGLPRTSTLSVDMGTAASITLVLQSVVPAVALTGSRLRLELVGGTDVPWSPTFDYFERVVREAYGSIGIVFRAGAERRGYYPRGGGRVTAEIEPCNSISALDLTSPQPIADAAIVSRCGNLPIGVAERQLASASEFLRRSGVATRAPEVVGEQSDSPGSSILIYHLGSALFIGSDSIGAKGMPAEEVGREAAGRFVQAAKSGAALDSNLGDMVIPLLSFAHQKSSVTVPAVTPHLESGLHLAEQFTGCRWSVERADERSVVRVDPTRSG